MRDERLPDSESEHSDVDRLLLACVHAEAGDRDAVLDRACGDHPGLAAELRLRWGLLQQVGFLDAPAEDAAFGDAAEPRELGRFRIVRRLGGGGMGVVYLAEQKDLGRQVALKMLRPEVATSDRARERFRREGVILSKLEHSGICPVYEVGDVDGVPFLAMRYLQGRTLAERIDVARRQAVSGSVQLTEAGAGAPASELGEAKRMQDLLVAFEQIARAVHAAHDAGLVHRDLKPANVMITQQGEPVVLDFGLARDDADDVGLTHSGDVLGTPAYLAPEQVQGGGRADPRTDVYALGVTLYECLTLVRPFTAGNRQALYRQILAGEFADVRMRNRHVPRDLAVVVATAIDRNPERRYVTAAALADDLRRVRLREPIAARPAGRALRSWRWTQRNPVLAAFVGFLVAGLLFAGVMTQRLRGSLQQTRALAVANLAFRVAEREPKAALWLAVQAWEMEPREETRSQLYAALRDSHEELRLSGHVGVVNQAR